MWNNTQDVSAIRGLNTYRKAYERWQNAKQWRGDDVGDHKPCKLNARSSKRQWSIRLNYDTSIACRYWNTDVVTFNTDGSITFEPWASKTTDQFANALMPSGLMTNFNNSKGKMVHCVDVPDRYVDDGGWLGRWVRGSRRIYALAGGAITFEERDDAWWPREPGRTTEAIIAPRVNVSAARRALRQYDFAKFKKWLATACALRGAHAGDWYRGDLLQADIWELVDDPALWPDLIRLRQFWPESRSRSYVYGRARDSYGWSSEPLLTDGEMCQRQARRIAEAVKIAIYERRDCVGYEALPYYTSYRHISKVHRDTERYPWVARSVVTRPAGWAIAAA